MRPTSCESLRKGPRPLGLAAALAYNLKQVNWKVDLGGKIGDSAKDNRRQAELHGFGRCVTKPSTVKVQHTS